MTLHIYHIDEHQTNNVNNNNIDILNNNMSLQTSSMNNKGFIVLLHSQHCGHCLSMKNDWDNFEKTMTKTTMHNNNIDIYTVENDFIHKIHPTLLQNIIGYPSILGLVNGKMISYDSKLYPRDKKHFIKFYNDIQYELNKNTRNHLTPYPKKNKPSLKKKKQSKSKSKTKSKTKSKKNKKTLRKTKTKTKN